MKKENKFILIYLAAFTYSIITGLSFIFGKIALQFSNPIDLLAYRFLASVLGVFFLVLFKVIKIELNIKKILKVTPLALLYPFLFFTFQTFGLQSAPAIEAGIITAAIPIFTLIGSTIFLKERSNKWQVISIIASVSGVIYLTVMKNSSVEVGSFNGVLFILLSTISFAAYTILARILTQQFSSKELTAVMVILSFVLFLAIALFKNIGNNTLNQFLRPLKEFEFILSVLYLGLLSTFGTSFLTNYVLSYIEASKMAVFANFGTIVTIAASVILLNERLYLYHIIGSILIVGGVLGANFLDKKKS